MGLEIVAVFTTMDGSWGMKRFFKNVPWVLWKGVGITIAMAIVINVFNSYHPNYVLSLKLYDWTMQELHMVLH